MHHSPRSRTLPRVPYLIKVCFRPTILLGEIPAESELDRQDQLDTTHHTDARRFAAILRTATWLWPPPTSARSLMIGD